MLTKSTRVAEDFMIPLSEYPHIHYKSTLKQAIEKMEKSVINVDGRLSLPRALLVFDEENQLIGIVRRRNILRGLEPDFLKTMAIPHRRKLFDIDVDPNLVDLSSGKMAEAIKKQAERPVSEVMIPIGSTVNHDDQLAKVIYKMVSIDMALIPVLKEDKVVGVIRTVELFREIANLLI